MIKKMYETVVKTEGMGTYISLSSKANDVERVKVRCLFGGAGWMVEDSLNIGGFFHQKKYDLFDDAIDHAYERHNNKKVCISLKRINPPFTNTIFTS